MIRSSRIVQSRKWISSQEIRKLFCHFPSRAVHPNHIRWWQFKGFLITIDPCPSTCRDDHLCRWLWGYYYRYIYIFPLLQFGSSVHPWFPQCTIHRVKFQLYRWCGGDWLRSPWIVLSTGHSHSYNRSWRRQTYYDQDIKYYHQSHNKIVAIYPQYYLYLSVPDCQPAYQVRPHIHPSTRSVVQLFSVPRRNNDTTLYYVQVQYPQ